MYTIIHHFTFRLNDISFLLISNYNIKCHSGLNTPNGARLESKLQQGGISLATPLSPEGQSQSLPPILGN